MLTGCGYDDSDIWDAVENVSGRVDALESTTTRLNSDLAAMNTIVNALENRLSVTDVSSTPTGYEIKFSDGTSASINHGRDGATGATGADGVSAPEISIKQDSDGDYYWTMGGEWLLVDGKKVRANGKDGKDGKDGLDGADGKDGIDGQPGADGKPGEPGTPGANSGDAPQVRVNPETKEWEISVNGGKTWNQTGVLAEGKPGDKGDSMFKSIDTSNADYVTFVLADESEFRIPRYSAAMMPIFEIDGADKVQIIPAGTNKSFAVRATNVADYTIQKPDGWKVTYNNGELTVTSPVDENKYAETEGTISVVAVSDDNKSVIAKLEVAQFELRILTFEDADAMFSPYNLEKVRGGAKTIASWSDLIDSPQYGGPMTYNDYSETDYYWYDENNTYLKSEIYSHGAFWNGGQLISNYYSASYDGKGYTDQLTVSTIGASEGHAGHNGSTNFCVHNGYKDDTANKYGYFYFGDNVERVVDHMYVNNTSYALNSLANGDGFNTAATPDTWVKLVAIGCDSSGKEVGKAEIYLCKDLKVVNEWIKFDLSSLGKVAGIWFNFEASADQKGSYGLNFPAYFAYDDVAVRF